MVDRISYRIKIAIIASLLVLAILLVLQLAGVIPGYIHIFPGAFAAVILIFAISYFVPFKK